MSFEELNISKSCETYVLQRTPLLMSAFPGYIVFGDTVQGQCYINQKCLKIKYFDFHKLSVCIAKFLEFVAQENKETEVISLFEEDTFFWQGFSKTFENESEKFIKFIISADAEKNELVFSLVEFNNFIFVLRRCLISCLCLKDDDELFIFELIKNDEQFIISCKKSYNVACDFVNKYLSSRCLFQAKKAPFIELIRYHNEIFLELKKLHDIFVEEDSQTS